MFAIVVVAFD
ncbi:Protein of unknown function [Propionibacterium freudenreichii]|nr:Protein of unknown function [Propionibacterium freudenreichii]